MSSAASIEDVLGGARTTFENEGRSMGRHLFQRLLAQAREAVEPPDEGADPAGAPQPEARTTLTMREVDPAALVRLQAERLLDAPEPLEGPALAPGGFRNQRSLAFTCRGAEAVAGLTLWFESPVTVFIDPATGNAGPFQDIAGNGTTCLQLTNPDEAVGPASTVALKVRSSEAITLREWGWLHIGPDPG